MKISNWLKNYIKDRGGVMNVTIRTAIGGWWTAYKTPSGLMGMPEALENFEEFDIDDIKIYIERSILSKYVIDNEILMVIEGYGRFKLENVYDSLVRWIEINNLIE